MEEKDKEVEIDLLELAQKLWNNKKFIVKVTLVSAVVGLIIAFSIPKEYTTTVVFTTDPRDPMGGGMGALASLAGFNLNSSLQTGEVLSPDFYPDIILSTAFIKELFDIKVTDPVLAIDTSLYYFFKDEQKNPWWSTLVKIPGAIIGLLKSSEEGDTLATRNHYYISKDELGVIQALRDSYSISTEKKTGITTFEVTTQSPIISAFLADTITSYLQSYIIKERTRKAKTDLESSEKLYDQSKVLSDSMQQKLATFIDRNKNISSARYAVNQKALENEATLAYSLYTQMAQQVQMNKIKVQDDTPVFTIIQPAVAPLKASKPSRKVILFGFAFLGVFLGSVWILKQDIKDIIFS